MEENQDHTGWILDAIGKILRQRDQPNESNIYQKVRRKYHASEKDVHGFIEKALEQKRIVKLLNINKAVIYCDPKELRKRSSRQLSINTDANLVKVIVRSVEEIGESGGTCLSRLEEHINLTYTLNLVDTDFRTILEKQTDEAVLTGQLVVEGNKFNLPQTVVCKLCNRGEEANYVCGRLYTHDDGCFAAHKKCMVSTTGMVIGHGSADFGWKKMSAPKNKMVRLN